MFVFKIKENGFAEIKKRLLIRTFSIMLPVAVVGIAIAEVNTKKEAGDINAWPFVIPMVMALVVFSVFRRTSRQKKLFESYLLTITNNLITRQLLDTPTISVYYNDVTEIVRNKNGSLIIKTTDARDVIFVPAQIDNMLQLEAILKDIKPITVNQSKPLLRNPNLLGFFALGLMLCIYLVNNKIIVVVSGLILVPLLIWSLIKTLGNRNLDDKTRAGSLWVLLVLASMIVVMYYKLAGLWPVH